MDASRGRLCQVEGWPGNRAIAARSIIMALCLRARRTTRRVRFMAALMRPKCGNLRPHDDRANNYKTAAEMYGPAGACVAHTKSIDLFRSFFSTPFFLIQKLGRYFEVAEGNASVDGFERTDGSCGGVTESRSQSVKYF